MDLQVIGCQASVLRDSRKHLGPDLLAIVEGEDEVRRSRPTQRPMRSGLPLDDPPQPKQRRQYATRLG